jgi:hypothetical protein
VGIHCLFPKSFCFVYSHMTFGFQFQRHCSCCTWPTVDAAHLRVCDGANALCCVCPMPLLHGEVVVSVPSGYCCTWPLTLLIFECVTGQMHFVAFVRCLCCAVRSFFQSPPVYCCTWPLMLLIFECVTGQMHFVAFVRCLCCTVRSLFQSPPVTAVHGR